MTKYINIYGGPGVGKSTIAAGLFYKMKAAGHNVELVTEFAKELVWEERSKTLENQVYVDAKQYRNLKRVQGKVDYVITDRPVLLGVVYAKLYSNLPESYANVLAFLHEDLGDNVNIILKRTVPYVQTGRNETVDQAQHIDNMLFELLTPFNHIIIEPDLEKIYERVINA